MREVTVSYGGDHPALIGASLTIDSGEVVAILGANGSGKSTLLKAILGLAPVVSGEILLYGEKLGSGRSGHNRLGYVPQRHTVGGGVPATVEEVVASGRLLRKRFLPPLLGASDRGLICEAIATVGLTEKIGHRVDTLSGGQQRRVLIARALAGEASVLLMDEPFAGVDVPNQEILASTLSSLVDLGTTLVIVTHELGPMAPLVRRAVVVEHGRIGYDGPPTPKVLSVYGGADPHRVPSVDPAEEVSPWRS